MSTTKDRIIILMNMLNLNAHKLSLISDVDCGILSRILSGKQEPSVETLKKISEATKTSPEWILGYGDDNTRRELP